MKITLHCEVCCSPFERERGEHNRNIKLGRKAFCSRKCQGTVVINNIPAEARTHAHLPKGSEKDEFSPFRPLMKVMRLREHKAHKYVNVTLQDLKSLWEKQNGLCPHTGWQLVLPTSTKDKLAKTPNRASVDRIDSNRGYEKDNIQIVAMMYQFAKNSWSDADVQVFCKAVTERNK